MSSTGEPPAHVSYGPPQVRTNPLAIAALVCGVATFACYVTWLPALILGYMARRQIDRDPQHEAGRGLAVAGIVLGWVGFALTLIFVGFLAVVLIAGSGSMTTGPLY